MPYNRQEQKKRLDKARRDLAALGKINPLATEEFEALEERNKYLNDQRNDVVKSRDDLMQLIKDLDSTMVQVFKSAFDDTAEAFEQMFATLFQAAPGDCAWKTRKTCSPPAYWSRPARPASVSNS